MKQRIVLIASVLVGFAAFVLTSQYLKSEREKLYRGATKIKVLVADRDLSEGTVLKSGDLAQRSEFKTAVGEMIVLPDDYDVVIGKRMLMPLKRNEMLTWTHVDIPERGRLGLSSMIQHDRRAISIGVSGPNAVSGLVLPNDHVDILGTFALPSRQAAGETEVVTLTLLQDVTVLATGTRLGKQLMYGGDQWSSGAGGYSAVSLEVTPREAEVLVFAQQMKGQLTLSLRNRDDVGFVRELPEVDFKRLESELPNLNDYRQREIWKKKEL